MTKETYDKAKSIKEALDTIDSKMRIVRKMKERDSSEDEFDEEFNTLRHLAFEALGALEGFWNKKFEQL